MVINDECVLTVRGPVARATTALMALRALGFVETHDHAQALLDFGDFERSAPVPWREAFPPLSEVERPGRMLRAARTKEDMSQMHLAALTGIPQRHISEMEHGKRAIGKERAKKLAEVLHIDYRVFL